MRKKSKSIENATQNVVELAAFIVEEIWVAIFALMDASSTRRI